MAIEPHNNNKALQDLLEKLNTSSGGNSNHETLLGLLGGDASGHFHITAAQLTKLNALPDNGNSNHEYLQGLLGGNSSGHYHMTKEELNKLSAYPEYSNLNHERLQGLLGGNSAGHYHLTVDLLNKLINLPADGGGGGSAATIQIGTVTTGAAGSFASVTNSGTSTNAIFNFVIPRGDKGDKGDSGSGSSTTIIDNLTSTRSDAALSANMGRELNSKINNYYIESWTFTLDDNTTVTKKVVLSS